MCFPKLRVLPVACCFFVVGCGAGAETPATDSAPEPETMALQAGGGDQAACEAKGDAFVCHIEPGNPENAVNICVGKPSVFAHLNHGDRLGPCAQGATLTTLLRER